MKKIIFVMALLACVMCYGQDSIPAKAIKDGHLENVVSLDSIVNVYKGKKLTDNMALSLYGENINIIVSILKVTKTRVRETPRGFEVKVYEGNPLPGYKPRMFIMEFTFNSEGRCVGISNTTGVNKSGINDVWTYMWLLKISDSK